MVLYINDLSLRSGKKFKDNWQHVKNMKALVDTFSSCQIPLYAHEDIWRSEISGVNVQTGISTDGTMVNKEYINYVQQIYKKFTIFKDTYALFSMNEDMINPSASLGSAASGGGVALSFAFDERFKVDKLDGWLRCNDDVITVCSLDNIYEDRQTNYTLLADLTVCRLKNPIREPMWNTDMIRALMRDVDFINLDTKDRQSKLVEYGRYIAKINGWRYNRVVSMKNRNKDRLRYIFDSSSNFTSYPTAYLSIDLEGPEPAFEICDSRGRHKGEISWDGKVKPSKCDHGIIV